MMDILASSVGWMPRLPILNQLLAPLILSVEATNSSRTSVIMKIGAYHFLNLL
ncbi:hypothetical protein D3C87_1885580 [compost metagenome]